MHLLVISILPAAVLMLVIYKCDRVEPEPAGLVLAVMGFGMLTILPAMICEAIGEGLLSVFLPQESILFQFLDAFFVIALTEEFWKRFVIRTYIWKKPAFNYRFDAIVYCVASSLGFALLENIFYVFGNGFGTGIMRALLSVPGHCTDAIFMGLFIGNAKLCQVRGNRKKYKMYMAWSLWMPVMLHGFYDFCLGMDSIFLILVFLMFVIICDVTAIVFVILSEKQDAPFYVLKEGDRWIDNPVWLQMAAASLNMDVPDMSPDTREGR